LNGKHGSFPSTFAEEFEKMLFKTNNVKCVKRGLKWKYLLFSLNLQLVEQGV
jgi:hypothetical protein